MTHPDFKQTESGLYIPTHVIEMHSGQLSAYCDSLSARGRSPATVEKYKRDINAFLSWLGNHTLTITEVRAWISFRLTTHSPTSINCALAALNSFFAYISRPDCVVERLRVEKTEYRDESRCLTREDYEKLQSAAQDNPMLLTLLYTFAGTGIRVSELRFFTVEAVRTGLVPVRNKGKSRIVVVNKQVCKALLSYAREPGITSGPIFRNRRGSPLSRHEVWALFKQLAVRAGVDKSRVYPHAFRALFARELYRITKDLNGVRKALGHGSADTTLIYLRETVMEHQKLLEEMKIAG